MKNEMKIFTAAMTCLAIIPSLVTALGEVAGPVTVYTQNGQSGAAQWGIFNSDPITVTLSAQGDAAKYLSFPTSVNLTGNNQISDVPITAAIPSSANLPEGTNVTGTLYALAQGQPGQVQINLQVEKNVFIVIGNAPTTTSTQTVSSSESPIPSQQTGSMPTGLASLPTFDFNLAGAAVAGIALFLAFVFISRRLGFRQEAKSQSKRR